MQCPHCAAAELLPDTRDLPYCYKGESTQIPQVTGDFCPACHEAVLDISESNRVSAAVLAFHRQVNANSVDPQFITTTPNLDKCDNERPAPFASTKLQTVANPGGCFVAGTLVHTKDGLKPIEQIQIGDWVLSKPESGEGEVAYKRVVNTFSFADKEIWSVDFIVGDDLDNGLEGLIVTGNHPFWVKGEGWTRVDHLYQSARLLLADGREATVFSIKPVYKTEAEGIGYIQDGLGAGARDIEEGVLIDLRHGFMQRDYAASSVYQPFYSGEGIRFGTRVYNFEVEDCHTYYAGRFGIWVHNSSSCKKHKKRSGLSLSHCHIKIGTP